MPVLENSIGTAEFQDLVGTIYPRQAQIELIDRPGVDGVGARNTGTKGKPFKLVSVTYHANFAAAASAMTDYIALKSSLQILVRNDEVFGSALVQDVTEATPPQAVYNVAGAIGAQCRAEVEWTLVMMG
jgi:hypothetical protein